MVEDFNDLENIAQLGIPWSQQGGHKSLAFWMHIQQMQYHTVAIRSESTSLHRLHQYVSFFPESVMVLDSLTPDVHDSG